MTEPRASNRAGPDDDLRPREPRFVEREPRERRERFDLAQGFEPARVPLVPASPLPRLEPEQTVRVPEQEEVRERVNRRRVGGRSSRRCARSASHGGEGVTVRRKQSLPKLGEQRGLKVEALHELEHRPIAKERALRGRDGAEDAVRLGVVRLLTTKSPAVNGTVQSAAGQPKK